LIEKEVENIKSMPGPGEYKIIEVGKSIGK